MSEIAEHRGMTFQPPDGGEITIPETAIIQAVDEVRAADSKVGFNPLEIRTDPDSSVTIGGLTYDVETDASWWEKYIPDLDGLLALGIVGSTARSDSPDRSEEQSTSTPALTRRETLLLAGGATVTVVGFTGVASADEASVKSATIQISETDADVEIGVPEGDDLLGGDSLYAIDRWDEDGELLDIEGSGTNRLQFGPEDTGTYEIRALEELDLLDRIRVQYFQ